MINLNEDNINLIGIHGKINSGKDTVGTIIQYLMSDYFPNRSFEKFLYNYDSAWAPPVYDWEIRKFADKLKEIVCLLIGCTREQLEDREFKETPLGEEWTCWQYNSFDMDTSRGTIFVSKEQALKWLEVDREEDLDDHERLLEVPMTPRLMLQLLGTEAGREIIHPNIWVNALFADYVEDAGYTYKAKVTENNELKVLTKPVKFNNGFPKWIITDVRFPNEAKAIVDRGGILIKVVRPETDHLAGRHESETALDNYVGWDAVIHNDSDIDNLIENVINKLFTKKQQENG